MAQNDSTINDNEYPVQDADDSSIIFDTIQTDLESLESKKTPGTGKATGQKRSKERLERKDTFVFEIGEEAVK